MVVFVHMVSVIDSSVTLTNGANVLAYKNSPILLEFMVHSELKFVRKAILKHIFRFLSFTVIYMLGSTYVYFIANIAGI